MSAISTILARLRAAIWAIDVRDDIANAIEQCYSDVSNPTLKTEALEAALQNKIDEGKMAALTIGDGTITGAKLANGTIPKAKLDPSITFDADAALDPTSTNAIQNKVVASELATVKAYLDALEPGLSDDAKAALLACFRHVARWDNGNGQIYYNNLYAALYPDVVPVSINATFAQGQAVIYDTDNLAVLRQYLTVTATMAGGTTETVTDYTLSGTLTSGTSTITVTHQTKTTTFTVSVTHDDSPNISTGEIIQGYYFDASGGEVSGANSILNREYFPVSPNTTYTWVQGFQGNHRTARQELLGACNTYRICYYTSDKTFISREVNSWYSTTWEYIEPRYYSFTTPSDAAYIRVSCSMLPIGKIYRAVPSYMYAVTLLLAYQDNSTITSKEDLFERVSIFRNGVNITAKAMRDNVVIDDSLSFIPPYWRLAAFNCNSGGTPEEGNQTETDTRMFNDKTFLLEAGDVITFNNVKYGVRCENVGDSTVLHTSAWVTDNSDYIVGV